MDQILQKHLLNKILFSGSDSAEINNIHDDIIYYNSYKRVDNSFYIKINEDVLISEGIGCWKNKPVLSYKNKKYVLLENSKSIVNIKNFGVEKLDPLPKPIEVKKEEIVIPKKVEEKKPSEPEKKVQSVIVKTPEQEKKKESDYVSGLKAQDESPKETVTKSSEDPEELFFSILDKKRDDPRIKKFFNYHSDLAKKELFAITEKFTREQMSRAMESGGGTNSVQYSNGGSMHGDLIIDGNLTVTGTSNIGTTKKVFYIGNGTDNEYLLVHSLNTKDIFVTMYDSNDEMVIGNVKNISLNETKVSFANPIDTNSIKVVVIG